MEKIIIKKADYIFTESNFIKNRLKEEYNINDNKIFILPCGFKCPNVKYLYFKKKER